MQVEIKETPIPGGNNYTVLCDGVGRTVWGTYEQAMFAVDVYLKEQKDG